MEQPAVELAREGIRLGDLEGAGRIAEAEIERVGERAGGVLPRLGRRRKGHGSVSEGGAGEQRMRRGPQLPGGSRKYRQCIPAPPRLFHGDFVLPASTHPAPGDQGPRVSQEMDSQYQFGLCEDSLCRGSAKFSL